MNGNGNNNYYTFEIEGNELGKGSHTYYFHFEEAYGGVAETDEETFKVVKSIDFSTGYFSLLKKVVQQFIHHRYIAR